MKYLNAIKLLQKEIERIQGDSAQLEEVEYEGMADHLFSKDTIENNTTRIKELQDACMVLIKTTNT